MPGSLTTRLLMIGFCALSFLQARSESVENYHLLIAPGTVTQHSVTLLWDKQFIPDSAIYEISLNGVKYTSTTKTNCTVTGLLPGKWYTIALRVQQDKDLDIAKVNTVRFKTAGKGRVFNILNYGAKNDSLTKSTAAIQAAIDACSEGGTVVIPKGIFVAGALFLKSNMTLYLEPGAVLKGSIDTADYLPMILNRFEGWELETYASLLNAGTLNQDGTYNVHDLSITGGGTIMGGGVRLGEAMIKANGIRSRGRLICLMNCQDVNISGLTITEPPGWAIHYIYSNNITCHDLNIVAYGILNGNGIDPDSSTDSYIFNCVFDTGDDCIAIKSGKNPEGYYIGKPTQNVQITHCDFRRGHGISIGSEISGGISDVLVQDCQAGALLHGMQIKGTKERGGYVKNIIVTDCQLLQITIFSSLEYNNDGEPAPEIPIFENFVFKHIDLSGASVKEPVIDINGFQDSAHHLKNVAFSDVILPENAKVVATNADHVNFIETRSVTGVRPRFVVNNCTDIIN